MNSLEILIKIAKEEYPMLFKLKKRERDKLVKSIFKTGYKIHCPNVEESENGDNIKAQLVELKNIISNSSSNSELIQKLHSLEGSLEKLIGLSNSSMKKGEFAENILENVIETRYGDIQFKNMAQIEHSGDAWLTLSDGSIIMVESKNYINKVNKDEILKMKNDMVSNHILYSIFVSWHSLIQGMREFDIHTFTHNGETYTTIMISNLTKDISRLDLGIQVIRKLISNYQNLPQFPWVVQDIKEDLNQLNELIKINYKIRDKYDNMEIIIKTSLDQFYQQLREYQYQLNNKTKQILNKIDSTMKASLSIADSDIETLIHKYKSKKHVFPNLSKLCDTCLKLNWILSEGDSNLIFIHYLDEEIGKIKISNKKLTLHMTKGNLKMEFNKNNDSNECLGILKSIYGKNNIEDINI